MRTLAKGAVAVLVAIVACAVLAGCGLFNRATPDAADVIGEWQVDDSSLGAEWPGAWVRLGEDGRYEGSLPGPIAVAEFSEHTLVAVRGGWKLRQTVMGHWEVVLWPDKDDTYRFGGKHLVVGGTTSDPVLELWIDRDAAEVLRFRPSGDS